jgi:hypothetical protein
MKTKNILEMKKKFALRYIPILNNSNFAFCHLVFGGEIIGDENETCYLSSWKNSLKKLKDRIENNSSSLYHEEFNNRNDRELFELIWKANQQEEHYSTEYSYLPVLDNEIWSNCHISIDETTDAYLIAMTEDNGEIKFLWEGLREPCAVDKIGELFSINIDKNLVVETIENCLIEIENNTIK